jgi:hypothetical protein
MDILVALKQEEAKWEKQAEEARQQLETVRAAIKLFRGETGKRTSGLGRSGKATGGNSGKATGGKKRVMSAAARAKISKATKERWAKYRAAKAKGKS